MDTTFPSPPKAIRPQRSTVLKHIRSLTFPFFSGQMWKNPRRGPSWISQQACTVRTETFPNIHTANMLATAFVPTDDTLERRAEEAGGCTEPHPEAYCTLCVAQRQSVKKKKTMTARGLTRKTWWFFSQ